VMRFRDTMFAHVSTQLLGGPATFVSVLAPDHGVTKSIARFYNTK
jgi:hypothetical protein